MPILHRRPVSRQRLLIVTAVDSLLSYRGQFFAERYINAATNVLTASATFFAVFSTINLLGIYHDTILTKHVASLPATHRPAPSPLNRYTRDWQNSSPVYKHIVLLLTVIQYTEVLIEMSVQKKWGQKYKWRVITALETIKYVNWEGALLFCLL